MAVKLDQTALVKPKTVRALVESPDFVREVGRTLPDHIKGDRFARLMLTAINRTPKLSECSMASVAQALMDCAYLGLEPNTPLGHAYLVPFKAKNKDGTYVTLCQFVLGYKGMLDLFYRSGKGLLFEVDIVFSNDTWEYSRGLATTLTHTPTMIGDRGDPLFVYSIARMDGADPSVCVMRWDDVMSIKARSKAKFGPWQTDEYEMSKKTCCRRHMKLLPMNPRVQEAINREEESSTAQQFYETAPQDTVTRLRAQEQQAEMFGSIVDQLPPVEEKVEAPPTAATEKGVTKNDTSRKRKAKPKARAEKLPAPVAGEIVDEDPLGVHEGAQEENPAEPDFTVERERLKSLVDGLSQQRKVSFYANIMGGSGLETLSDGDVLDMIAAIEGGQV